MTIVIVFLLSIMFTEDFLQKIHNQNKIELGSINYLKAVTLIFEVVS